MDDRQQMRASDADRQEVVLVSATTAQLIYPWPLWVAGPYGAALFAISAVVAGSRAQKRPVR